MIPGTEFLLLTGIEGLPNTPLLNCCLKYEIKINKDYSDIHVAYAPEDFYDFHDKFQNVDKILINPKFNNDELYFKYGIQSNANQFDYYNLNATNLFKIKTDGDTVTNTDSYKNNIDPILRMSCNEYDVKNILYYLKILSMNSYLDNFSRILKIINEKIFTIDALFEQNYNSENHLEIIENLKFLSNKKLFFQNLYRCLENVYTFESNNIELGTRTKIKSYQSNEDKDNYRKVEL